MNMLDMQDFKILERFDGATPSDILKFTGQESDIPVNLGKLFNYLNISVLPMDFNTKAGNHLRKVKGSEIFGVLVNNTQNNTLTIMYNSAALGLGKPIMGNDGIYRLKNYLPFDFYPKASVFNLSESYYYRYVICKILGHLCIEGKLNHIEYQVNTESYGINHIEFHKDKKFTEQEMFEFEKMSIVEKQTALFARTLLIPAEGLQLAISKMLVPSVASLAKMFKVPEIIMRKRLEDEDILVNRKILEYNYFI